MKNWASNFIILLKKIGLLLGVYAICRILFYWLNHSYFSNLGVGEFFYLMLVGIRFDLSVIILSNSLFIILHLLPIPIRETRIYRSILLWLFTVVNSIAILANCVDLKYFQFTLKRTTADVFNFFGGQIGNDLQQLLPLFLKEYWYIFFIWILLTIITYYYYKKLDKNYQLIWNFRSYLSQFIVFIIGIPICILGYRGGFQLKPINAASAGVHTTAKFIPLVVSTPFSILKTLDVQTIEPTIFYSDQDELKSIYNPFHKSKGGEFKKMNILVIALESFSKEYIGALNGKPIGYTPFLDSLIGESLTFTNAFSNGKSSIQGIPSIIAGIPTWMSEPYITSVYASNQISSMAGLLKDEGYYTAFFHGGTNGTMGFDVFSKIAGFEYYYGRTEYNNEKDYDGNWGIWDEEFLQFSANTINQKQKPFFATIFTLTSHHPYPIPDKYKGKFKEGELPIQKSISYSDFALRKFFETVKKMPWYKNTLFVLSADHTGVSSDPFFQNKTGSNTIPIIYFLPDGSMKRHDSTVTQQIDIQPSILDFINYPKDYFSFGTSVFDTTAQRFAFMYDASTYQYIENNYALEFNGEKATELYDFHKDSLLKNNLINEQTEIAKKLDRKVKAILQTYQQSLIHNKMR